MFQTLANEFVKYPTKDSEIRKIKSKVSIDMEDFQRPSVQFMAHRYLHIKPPSNNEEAYVSRKGGHSINCQVICDTNQRFLDAVVKWPGATHDSTIWNCSGVKSIIEEYTNRRRNGC